MIAVSLVDMYFPLCRTDGFFFPTIALSLGGAFLYALNWMVGRLERFIFGANHYHGHSNHSGHSELILPLFTSVDKRRMSDSRTKLVKVGSIGRSDSKLEKTTGLLWNKNKRNYYRLAILMMISLTAHNFPEGLAVGLTNL